jgi:FixJ family two-component response regulator
LRTVYEREGARLASDVLVAVVDDDVSVRRSLARLLGLAGFQVTTFPSAQHYLKQRTDAPVGCLVLDVHLGGLDGFGLHQLLRASGDETPVVFMTAFDDAPTRDRAHQSGAAGYLRKPFDASSLLETVCAAVGLERPTGSQGFGRE